MLCCYAGSIRGCLIITRAAAPPVDGCSALSTQLNKAVFVERDDFGSCRGIGTEMAKCMELARYRLL